MADGGENVSVDGDRCELVSAPREIKPVFCVVCVTFVQGSVRDAGVVCTCYSREEAVARMLTDYLDQEAENSGYFEAQYNSSEAVLWYDSGHDRGIKWKVVRL